MSRVIRQSLVFVAVPVILIVLSDLLLFGFYQGGPTKENAMGELAAHGVICAAVFVLSGMGAFTGFFAMRHRFQSAKYALFTGLLFSVASFFAVVLAFGLGGPVALGVWLFLGAFAFTLAGPLLERLFRPAVPQSPP